MSNLITGPIQTTDEFPTVPPVNGPMVTVPASSPLRSPDPHVRAMWQASLNTIRKRNRAAQANGGKRVPLA